MTTRGTHSTMVKNNLSSILNLKWRWQLLLYETICSGTPSEDINVLLDLSYDDKTTLCLPTVFCNNRPAGKCRPVNMCVFCVSAREIWLQTWKTLTLFRWWSDDCFCRGWTLAQYTGQSFDIWPISFHQYVGHATEIVWLKYWAKWKNSIFTPYVTTSILNKKWRVSILNLNKMETFFLHFFFTPFSRPSISGRRTVCWWNRMWWQ
jgi:hypothetical protein